MRRAVFFALVLAAAGRPLPAQLPPWSDDAQKAWWAAHVTLPDEAAAANDLDRELALDYQKNGAAVFAQSDFQNWLDLYLWVKLGAQSGPLLAQPQNFEAFVALGQDDRISHQLVEKMEPADKGPAALAILLRLAQASLADLHEYAALGIAYALVFDVPFPDDWPHSQVTPSAVPIGDTDPLVRFQYYVAANRARQLDLDPTQLSFENLKFLVNSEVKLSELTWAQQNTANIPYSHFSDAFFSIEYATVRVSGESDVFDWNLLTYRLQDIKQAGGICIDQSYYAATVGKARGIPTLMLTGLGDMGAHAWFGYLDRSGAWQLDCGRYEQQNYAKGYTLDPQTWEELKDTDLEQTIKNGVNDPSYPAAHAAHAALAWARLQGDTPAAKPAYEDAHTIMPTLAEVWRAEADYLDRTNASVDDQKAFYDAWVNQVAPYPDQKVAAQRRLVGELRKANDASADTVEQDIILQNRSGGVDLAVQGTKEAIDDHFQAHDWDGARMEFERAVRDFGETGGATFYYRLFDPYWRDCLYYGQVEQAANGIHFTEERTKLEEPDADGNLSTIGKDMAKLKKHQASLEKGLGLMQTWLQEIDGGQADQAYGEATPTLQSFAPSDQWEHSIAATRQKLGNVTARVLTSIAFHTALQRNGSQLIEGPFVQAKFATACDSGGLEENVIFQRTGEDAWQAFWYEAKPAKGLSMPAAASP